MSLITRFNNVIASPAFWRGVAIPFKLGGLLRFARNDLKMALFCLLVAAYSLDTSAAIAKTKKKQHPFDVYDHQMHNSIFESAGVSCETCHADPASYGDRKKVNPLGCHTCHNSPNPTIPANNDCKLCHAGGFPKPESHKTSWISKHQVYAKQNPKDCTQCHTNQMFCIDCHQRRDTIQERMHRRNFKFFHSIEARANPRKCDACHTINYCQQCHAGRGDSSK